MKSAKHARGGKSTRGTKLARNGKSSDDGFDGFEKETELGRRYIVVSAFPFAKQIGQRCLHRG